MNKEEFIQLRDLLIKYGEEEAGPNDSDTIDYFVDEIEKNGLNMDHQELTTTQRWWKGLSEEEKQEIRDADGYDPRLP